MADLKSEGAINTLFELIEILLNSVLAGVGNISQFISMPMSDALLVAYNWLYDISPVLTVPFTIIAALLNGALGATLEGLTVASFILGSSVAIYLAMLLWRFVLSVAQGI